MSDVNIMAVVLSAAIINYAIRVTPFLMTNWEKVPLAVRRFFTYRFSGAFMTRQITIALRFWRLTGCCGAFPIVKYCFRMATATVE